MRMKKRLTIFVEGDTDQSFFDHLISFLFENAGKKRWDKSCLYIIPLDGICKAEALIRTHLQEIRQNSQFDDTVCLIYDTDAFEYQKQPPVKMGRVKQLVEENGCSFLAIPVVHNVEDMMVFSLKEICEYLQISPSFKIPEGLSGLALLKRLHKEAGQFYVKGHKCEDLIKRLDYSSICKKYCDTLNPLCKCFGFDCKGNLCRIRKKRKH